MKSGLIFITLSVVCIFGTQTVLVEGQSQTDDWVDPGDMISFDPVLKKNFKSKSKNYPQQDSTATVEQKKSEYKNSKQKKTEDEFIGANSFDSKSSEFKESTALTGIDNVFMKRFLLFFMRKIANVERPEGYTEYEISVGLTEETWKTFEDYCNNLTKVSVQVFGILLLLVGCLTLETISHIAWTRQFLRLLVVMFLLSYASTYARMYQDEVARQRSSHNDVPDYCKGLSGKSLYDKISTHMRYWFSIAKDPCQEYHNAFNEPIFRVTPLKVLAATLSEFFLEPFEHMGTAFSRTFRNMFAELSIQLWFLAFAFIILAMISVVLILSVCFGYAWNLRLPFWSGFEIAPGGHAIEARHNEQLLENYRIQIENLNQVIRRLQDNRLPIEGGGNDGGWGAAFQRLLNFGHNRDNDGRNQAPHAAIAENLDNLALNPNQDIPPPAPDHGIPPAAPDHEIPPAAPVFEPDFVLPSHDNGGLRRRHPVPYPQNPPYPSNQNVVRPIPPPFIANSGGVAKVPELPTKQRTHSAEANLETATSEPDAEDRTKTAEIGFKRAIVEGCVPELPDYHQVVAAEEEDRHCSKTKYIKVTPQKPGPPAAPSVEDKPRCSKTLQPQQKTGTRSTASHSGAGSEGCVSLLMQNGYAKTVTLSKVTGEGDGKICSKVSPKTETEKETCACEGNGLLVGRSDSKLSAQEGNESSVAPSCPTEDEEDDKFVLVEGPCD